MKAAENRKDYNLPKSDFSSEKYHSMKPQLNTFQVLSFNYFQKNVLYTLFSLFTRRFAPCLCVPYMSQVKH